MPVGGEGRVPGRDQPVAHVAHQHRPVPVLARGPDGRVVDARGKEVEDAGFPHAYRYAADVAGLAHDPVVAVVDVLEHERLAVDHDPFESGTRLRVDRRHGDAARRAGDQLVDRGRDRDAGSRGGAPSAARAELTQVDDHLLGHGAASGVGAAAGDDRPRARPAVDDHGERAELRAGLRRELHRAPRRVRRRQPARRDVGGRLRVRDAGVDGGTDRSAVGATRSRHVAVRRRGGGRGGRRRRRGGRRGGRGGGRGPGGRRRARAGGGGALGDASSSRIARPANAAATTRTAAATTVRIQRRAMAPVSRPARGVRSTFPASPTTPPPISRPTWRFVRARVGRRRRRDHDGPLPGPRPRGGDQARPHPGHRGRPGGRGDDPGAPRSRSPRRRHPGRGVRHRGDAAAGGRRWIVDPIDGTKGYARGIPVWATLIALESGGELVAGVVSAPALGSRWSAASGSGAHRDGAAVAVSKVARIEDAHLAYDSVDAFESVGARRAVPGVGAPVLARPWLR